MEVILKLLTDPTQALLCKGQPVSFLENTFSFFFIFLVFSLPISYKKNQKNKKTNKQKNLTTTLLAIMPNSQM